MALSGEALYVGTRDSRLVIVNTKNPSAPTTFGSIKLPGVAVKMRRSGNRLLVALGEGGLLLFDVSAPFSPLERARLNLGSPVNDVAIDGNLAYVAMNGLAIVDITVLQAPVLVARQPQDSFGDGTSTIAASIAVKDGFAYVGSALANTSVYVFDCRRPMHPRLIGQQRFSPYRETAVFTLGFYGADLLVGGYFDLLSSSLMMVDASRPESIVQRLLAPDQLRANRQ
jgi:hypothetical protein